MTTTIGTNLEHIRQSITNTAIRCNRPPENIRLVAVSKRFPTSAIFDAQKHGQLLFGENYIQEAEKKHNELSNDVQLHFIGHLQSNKAKTAAKISSMIETVDRLKLAKALNRHCVDLNKNLDILIQVNIGKDPNKSGVLPEDTEQLVTKVKEFKNLQIRGLMTIPPITNSPEETRPFFQHLKELAIRLSNKDLLPQEEKGLELSMGMSSDYTVAIEEGATLIRVGTAIFGQRPPL